MKGSSGGFKEFAFIIPSLAGVLIFVFIPFCDVVRRSFTNVTGKAFTGLNNYKVIFTKDAFRLAIMNTGRFIIICVPILLILSLLIANMIYFSRATIFRNICLLPMAVPIATMVFVWKMIFHRNGLFNSWFGFERDWIHSSNAFGVLVASYLWKNTGYYVVLWMAGLSGIPVCQYEAAGIDGAGSMNKFLYITLPGLKPMINTTLILAITGTLKSYREAYLLAGEYPDKSIYMIQHMFHNWFRDMSVDKMAAGAVIIVCVFAVVVYPFRKKGGGICIGG